MLDSVPWEGGVAIESVTGFDSRSVAAKVMGTGTLRTVCTVCGTATGGSFTGLTVMVKEWETDVLMPGDVPPSSTAFTTIVVAPEAFGGRRD